jgi:hypothetical protein
MVMKTTTIVKGLQKVTLWDVVKTYVEHLANDKGYNIDANMYNNIKIDSLRELNISEHVDAIVHVKNDIRGLGFTRTIIFTKNFIIVVSYFCDEIRTRIVYINPGYLINVNNKNIADEANVIASEVIKKVVKNKKLLKNNDAVIFVNNDKMIKELNKYGKTKNSIMHYTLMISEIMKNIYGTDLLVIEQSQTHDENYIFNTIYNPVIDRYLLIVYNSKLNRSYIFTDMMYMFDYALGEDLGAIYMAFNNARIDSNDLGYEVLQFIFDSITDKKGNLYRLRNYSMKMYRVPKIETDDGYYSIAYIINEHVAIDSKANLGLHVLEMRIKKYVNTDDSKAREQYSLNHYILIVHNGKDDTYKLLRVSD